MSNFHFDLSLKLSQGEVHDVSGEVQNDLRGGAHLPTPPHTSNQNPAMLDFNNLQIAFMHKYI
jgi:hypothetical protein